MSLYVLTRGRPKGRSVGCWVLSTSASWSTWPSWPTYPLELSSSQCLGPSTPLTRTSLVIWGHRCWDVLSSSFFLSTCSSLFTGTLVAFLPACQYPDLFALFLVLFSWRGRRHYEWLKQRATEEGQQDDDALPAAAFERIESGKKYNKLGAGGAPAEKEMTRK